MTGPCRRLLGREQQTDVRARITFWRGGGNIKHARCLVRWLVAGDPQPEAPTLFVQMGFDEDHVVAQWLPPSALARPLGGYISACRSP